MATLPIDQDLYPPLAVQAASTIRRPPWKRSYASSPSQRSYACASPPGSGATPAATPFGHSRTCRSTGPFQALQSVAKRKSVSSRRALLHKHDGNQESWPCHVCILARPAGRYRRRRTAVAVSCDQQIDLRRDRLGRRCSMVSLLLVLGLVGCGGDGGDSGKVSKPTNSPPGGDVLGRRDAPPEGVKDQITFGGVGGIVTCQPGLEPPPRVTYFRALFSYQGKYDPADSAENDEVARGDQLWICLSGFSGTEPVQAEILRPDGRVFRRQARRPTAADTQSVVWDTLPSDLFGTYRVTARQGTEQVRSSFMLKPPTKPEIRVFGRRHDSSSVGPPGAPFTIVLVGLEPRRRVRLDFYRQGVTNGFRYVTSVPVTLNGRGEVVYMLQTAKDDPSGTYLVMTDVPGLVTEGKPPSVFFTLT